MAMALPALVAASLTQLANLVFERRRERRADTGEMRHAMAQLEERLGRRVDDARGELGRRIDDLGGRVNFVADRTAGIEGVVKLLLGFHQADLHRGD